jgi:hypothetical protein
VVVLKLTVQFLEPLDCCRSLAARSRSAFSRVMRAAMLSIICPLNEDPSFWGGCVEARLMAAGAHRRGAAKAGALRVRTQFLDVCVVRRDIVD